MPKNFGIGPEGNAVGVCARSGRKMRLSDMVEDGYLPGLMVDPAWREPEEPQETFITPIDEASVDNPSPENIRLNNELVFPTYASDFSLNNVFEANVEIGDATILIAFNQRLTQAGNTRITQAGDTRIVP